jgi:hypothetical protein
MNTFTCAACGGTFEKGWSDEEAAAEALEVWGPLDPDDEATVCDDCYKAIMAELS